MYVQKQSFLLKYNSFDYSRSASARMPVSSYKCLRSAISGPCHFFFIEISNLTVQYVKNEKGNGNVVGSEQFKTFLSINFNS